MGKENGEMSAEIVTKAKQCRLWARIWIVASAGRLGVVER